MQEGCLVLFRKVVSCYVRRLSRAIQVRLSCYTRRLSRVISEGCPVLCKVVSCYT